MSKPTRALLFGFASLLAWIGCLSIRIELSYSVYTLQLIAAFAIGRMTRPRLAAAICSVAILGQLVLGYQRLIYGPYPEIGFILALLPLTFIASIETPIPHAPVKIGLAALVLAPFLAGAWIMPAYPYLRIMLIATITVLLMAFWRLRMILPALWGLLWGLLAYYLIGGALMTAIALNRGESIAGPLLYGYVYRLPADLLQAIIVAKIDLDLGLWRIGAWIETGRLPPISEHDEEPVDEATPG